MLIGFLAMAVVFTASFIVWGNHIEHRIDRIDRIVIHRKQRHRREVVAGSGHSSPLGQPAPVQPAHHGNGALPHHGHHTSKPPAPAPAPTSPPAAASAPRPSPLPPTASPKAQPPGLLDPTLHTACSIADRLAHLCN